jgi:predicted metal-dependent hydrolase
MRENQFLTQDWPPSHSIRRSRRARTISIKISSQRGLEVILPTRVRINKSVIDLLNEKRDWIEKNADLLLKFQESSTQSLLPTHIPLACCDENWKVSYLYSPVQTQIILRPQNELTILGNIDDKALCFNLLKHWLRQRAEKILIPMLFSLSKELGLPFNHVSIRGQKTRWGSCSSQKKINLNYKLIFLSSSLVRHILIHELCHTVHLNHSSQFWRLVAKYDPHWRLNHRLSKREELQLPLWIEK